MAKKNPEKKILFLDTGFRDVLVCKKTTRRPYLEIFLEKPENVAQKNLGTVGGIFQIEDDSEDSSYIVNYLVSVIKKEYYSKTKRGAVESFEAALHKTNLALAKLAEHQNTGWVGKINAAVLAIEKNNLHLSKTGRASVLLARKNNLTDIFENDPEEDAHSPMKTFAEVVSGRLENGDRVILATKQIFEIFSLEEIKRSSLKFSQEEFIRFLKTALGSGLEEAAVLVADAEEKEILEEEKIEKAPTSLNAFSGSTFQKPAEREKRKTETLAPQEKQFIISQIKEEISRETGEFQDKRGHIYIKEGQFIKESPSAWAERCQIFREKITYFSGKIFKILVNAFGLLAAGLLGLIRKIIRKNEAAAPLPKNEEKAVRMPAQFVWATGLIFLNWLWLLAGKITRAARKVLLALIPRTSQKDVDFSEKEREESFFLPSFSRIKSIFSALSTRQKAAALATIVLIFVLPYLFLKWQKNEERKEAPSEIPLQEISQPLAEDKNVRRVENLNQIELETEIKNILLLKGKIFAVGKNEIVNPENQKKYPFEDGFGPTVLGFAMDDLNLLFAVSESKEVLSWSPVTEKFQPAALRLPEKTEVKSAATYLTYLYILDPSSNQVYRFPRGGEGFLDKTDRLRGEVDISRTISLALTDSIYLAEENAILKFFDGKKEAFELEATATPIKINRLHTQNGFSHLYALDNQNARILKLDFSGRIIAQYYHEQIKTAADFLADEEKNTLYFASGQKITNFSID